MASPFQQQSLRRKLVYIGLIVVLFTVSFVFRANFVEAKADELALREQNRGDVELTGSAVRLMLTGSRGLVVCVLWNTAMEKQKRNQWNELELIVRSLTKLQPHFIQPWLHQSWNLAYNVSVDCHDLRDLYFYVSRGLELLAEGERQNHHNPSLRYMMGIYYQHKVMQHDKTNALRSMLQVSCIDPVQRDPARFQFATADGRMVGLQQGEDYVKQLEAARAKPSDREAQAQLDEARRQLEGIRRNFEDFCKDHPQLARRLHEGLRGRHDEKLQFRCRTPDEVVQFLADTRKLPSLFEDVKGGIPGQQERRETPLKAPEKRFPLLPPPRPSVPLPQKPFRLPEGEEMTYETPLGDDVDAYALARAWFGYAQEPLPEPDVLPGDNKPIENRLVQRPAPFTTILFRDFPARAQSYIGERLEEEGWFDEGWRVPDWFPGGKFTSGEAAVVGTGPRLAQDAWRKAHLMWEQFGKQNGLLLSSEEEDRLNERAKLFRDRFGIGAMNPPGVLTPEIQQEPDLAASWESHARLFWSKLYQTTVNFNHHYFVSQVESTDDAIKARKYFYEAERLRLSARRDQALEKYEQALPLWKELMKKHLEFRRDSTVQEDTYELQLKYFQLILDLNGNLYKRLQAVQGFLGMAAVRPAVAPDLMNTAILLRPHLLPPPDLKGPFDEKDESGEDWIPDSIRSVVHSRSPGLGGKRNPPMPPVEIPPGMLPPRGGTIPQAPPGPPGGP